MPGSEAREVRTQRRVAPAKPPKPVRHIKPTQGQPEEAAKPEKRRGAFLIKLAVFCMGAMLLLSVVERQVQIAEKKEQLSQLQVQLDTQNAVNEELRNTLNDQQSLEDYAEKRARRDLDYAKPNERVYIDMGGE